MGYKYDVFISYSRDYPFSEWVREPFLPLFEGYLKAALNREPSIFTDQDIPTGYAWEATLKNALAHSRCLVGIWSPNYFQSSWCKYEYFVMLYRQRELKYGTNQNPSGLIVPVTVHDGDKFPKYAREIQFKDWENYAMIGAGFRETKTFVDFQLTMREWTKEVAEAVENAPDWNEDWLNDKWLGDTIEQHFVELNEENHLPKKKFKPPHLA